MRQPCLTLSKIWGNLFETEAAFFQTYDTKPTEPIETWQMVGVATNF